MFKTISIYTVSSCLVAAITTSAFAQGLEMETYTGKFLPSNSTILLTEDEALVIDAQFLRPDGQGLTAQVEATGRRLTAILITHEHPDHVFGAVELLKKFPEAKVYARQSVKKEIELYFRTRLLRWTEDFPEHLPTELFEITALTGDTFDFAGHEIQIVDLLPAETINATAYYVPDLKTYVAGDQIFYQNHAYITGGLNNADLWIESLEAVRSNYDIDTVVPGHGPVGGGSEVFNSSIGYLQEYANIYEPLLKQSVIVKHMLGKFPNFGMKEIVYMTVGPAVTAPDLIEMRGGNVGFSLDH